MEAQNGYQVKVNGAASTNGSHINLMANSSMHSMNGSGGRAITNGINDGYGGYSIYPQQTFQGHSRGIPADDTQKSSWDKYQYSKIYNALKDLEEYNVKISVPEFVFIGFQSSGKTSAVSQAAKLAVGVMKTGTASRCPTRFKLVNNKELKAPIIKVNGALCENNDDLTDKTLEINKGYADKDVFSNDIIEVRIESAQVPDLTFVDLPGLIKGDNKQFRASKRQLDALTGHYLHEQNPDGSYRYIPILVREPVDVEHDTHFEVNYIDALVQKYGPGHNKRISWRSDTLFIVNKFDKQINRSPASSLIEYMKYCCEYGQTVLTIMNAKNDNTSNLSQIDLNKFVKTVEANEEEKWSQVISDFAKMDDENLHELTLLKKEVVGVSKMNESLAEKMCEIVKKILPFIERQLEAREQELSQEIAGMIKQIDMCDPKKLKSQCVAFNNRFLQFLKEFYNGSLTPRIERKYHKSWSKEVNDFHVAEASASAIVHQWKYEIQPSKLENLLKSLTNEQALSRYGQKDSEAQERDEAIRRTKMFELGEKPAELLSLLEMELVASAAVNRIIDAWVCQVAYMPFPMYTDQDIVNICGTFYATKQPELWTSIRNVVLDAVRYLADASKHLAEMFRYKLKENADIIFKYTLEAEFGGSLEVKHNSILKLLERTLRDYKKEIDNIMDEFIAATEIIPKNQAQILDKAFCEETINMGDLMRDLLDSKHKSRYLGPNPNQTTTLRPFEADSSFSGSSKSRKYAPRIQKQSIFESSYDVSLHASNGVSVAESESSDFEEMENLELSPKDNKKRNGGRKKKSKSKDDKPDDEQEDEVKESYEEKRRRKSDKKRRKEEKRKKAAMEKFEAERRFNAENYDGEFYKQIYGLELNHQITFGSTSYEIPLIRHLSHCFWTNIKYFTIRDVIQKLSNRVMAHINQADSRMADAIQCGVDRRQVYLLINKLVDRTGVDVASLEKLIMSKCTIPIPKAINDLDDKEIQQIYGINRKKLVAKLEQKVNELNEYRKLKINTLRKIHAIKNNQFDQMNEIDIDMDDYKEDEQERLYGDDMNDDHDKFMNDRPKVGVYMDQDTVNVKYNNKGSDSEQLYQIKKEKKKSAKGRKKVEAQVVRKADDYSDNDDLSEESSSE